jgi:LmbE family N-acetylglucosaminyl deacetylase
MIIWQEKNEMKDCLRKFVHKVNIFLLCILLKFKSEFDNSDYFQRILIIAPHPDDEVLGLGGQIQRYISKGSKVTIIFLSDGDSSDSWIDIEIIRQNRIALSLKVAAILSVSTSDIYRLGLKDGFIPRPEQPGFEDAVEKVSATINSVKADVVFATHTLDYWPFDHVACAKIAYEAVKRSEQKTQLWYYWVWAWYNVRPWKFFRKEFRNIQKIDIRDQMLQKKRLMDIYLKSLTPEGKPWSGLLPLPLLKAFEFPYEIVERII